MIVSRKFRSLALLVVTLLLNSTAITTLVVALEVVDDDDWTEFILFSEQSIGDRLRLTRGEAGVVVVVGTGELQVDEVTYANELRSDENEGVGLTIGLGYGVKFKLLLTCWPLLLFAPNEGVGFEAKR